MKPDGHFCCSAVFENQLAYRRSKKVMEAAVVFHTWAYLWKISQSSTFDSNVLIRVYKVSEITLKANPSGHPTKHFSIPEPKNPPIDVSEQRKIRRSTDFEALKLWNDLSGEAAFSSYWDGGC